VLTNDEEEQTERTVASFLHRAGLLKRERAECIQYRLANTDGTQEAHWTALQSAESQPHTLSPRFSISDIYLRHSRYERLQLFRCCRLDEASTIDQKQVITPRGSKVFDDSASSAVAYINAMWSHVENGTRREPFISCTLDFECALWHSTYGLQPLLHIDGHRLSSVDPVARLWDFSRRSVREAMFAPPKLHQQQRINSARSREVLVDRPIPATAYTRVQVRWETTASYICKSAVPSSTCFPPNFDFVDSASAPSPDFQVLQVMPNGSSRPLKVRYKQQLFILKRGIGREQGSNQNESAARKWSGNSRQTSSEFLALLSYRALAVDVPDAAFYQCICHTTSLGEQRQTHFSILLTRYVQDEHPTLSMVSLHTAQQLHQLPLVKKEFVRGFAADVLLNNGDATGSKFENLIVLQSTGVGEHPRVYRVDAGGCLGHAAKGGYHYFRSDTCEDDYCRLTEASNVSVEKQVCTNAAWCRLLLVDGISRATVLAGLTIDGHQFKQTMKAMLNSTGVRYIPPEWTDLLDIIAVRVNQLRMRLAPELAVADDAEEVLMHRCMVCAEEVHCVVSAWLDKRQEGFQCADCPNYMHDRCVDEMDRACAPLCRDCTSHCVNCGEGGCMGGDCLVQCERCYDDICNPGDASCRTQCESADHDRDEGILCNTCFGATDVCYFCDREVCADHYGKCDLCELVVCTDEACREKHGRREQGLSSDSESDEAMSSASEDDSECSNNEDDDVEWAAAAPAAKRRRVR